MTPTEAARELAGGVRRLIDQAVDEPATATRLATYALRHVPDAGSEGSPFIPPLYAMAVADAMALPKQTRCGVAVASCLYFAAADLADDVADGDLRSTTGLDLNDVCRLLFLHQLAIAELPATNSERVRLVRLFADEGLRMAAGQERDLRGTDALESPAALEIGRDKTGAEFGACMAAPVVLAGLDPSPVLAFGSAFGALVQILTDYFDLFLDPTSDDWDAAKPSLPLRTGLEHPEHGPVLRALMAGHRSRPERKSRGLWHLVQANAAGTLTGARNRLCGEMKASAAESPCAELLEGQRKQLESWIGGVIDALVEYSADPPPRGGDPGAEEEACWQAGRAFLGADPMLFEARDVQRVNRDDGEWVGIFGRALACEVLAGTDAANLAPVLASLLGKPWLRFPTRADWPQDADMAGLMLQIDDGRPGAREARENATRRLLANTDRSAGFSLWLAGSRRERRELEAKHGHQSCPAATANALLGLHRRGAKPTLVKRGARALGDQFLAETPRESPRYSTWTTRYFVAHALLEIEPEHAAIDHICDLFAAKDCLSGGLGTELESALATWVLAKRGRARPVAWRRAIVDAQQADGGWAAAPLYRRFPDGGGGWYASRVVTTAFMMRALHALRRT